MKIPVPYFDSAQYNTCYPSPMFYALALCSMLGYALQNALLGKYAREVDGLSLAFYRNISFIVTLLPLLIGASRADVLLVLVHWKELLLAGICGGLCLMCSFSSMKFLPLGISHALTSSANRIVIVFLAWFLLAETLSIPAITIMLGIIACSALLSMQKYAFDHLDQRMLLGVSLALCAAVPLALTKYILTVLTRTADPLVSAYFWEISIGIAIMLMLGIRSICTKQYLQRISWKTFRCIALSSSPTLIGTGCFGLAISMGSLSIASTIGTGSLVVTSLLAWWWYKEILQGKQWILILLIVLGIAALRVLH